MYAHQWYYRQPKINQFSPKSIFMQRRHAIERITRPMPTIPRKSTHSRAQRAFTLIELLVVIAIISILIGILLPALSHAKQSAQSILCGSRMRQVATGWQIYADINKDISVPAQPGRYDDEERNIYPLGNGYQYRPRWFALIGAAAGFDAFHNPSIERDNEHTRIVDGSDVFLCPTVSEWNNTRNYAFGYNHQFLGNARFVNDQESGGFINFPVRAPSIQSSSTVMFADSLGTAAGKPTNERTQNQNDGSRDLALTAEGGHGYAIDPPLLTDNTDYADRRNRAPEHRSAPHDRHLGKANTVFCDGHLELLSLEDLGYTVQSNGAVDALNPQASNALFSGNRTNKKPPKLFR